MGAEFCFSFYAPGPAARAMRASAGASPLGWSVASHCVLYLPRIIRTKNKCDLSTATTSDFYRKAPGYSPVLSEVRQRDRGTSVLKLLRSWQHLQVVRVVVAPTRKVRCVSDVFANLRVFTYHYELTISRRQSSSAEATSELLRQRASDPVSATDDSTYTAMPSPRR